jgi:chromosomal replication initiator protein
MRLSSEIKLQKAEVNEDLIKKLVKKGEGENALEGIPKNYSTDKVIEAVCKHYSVSKRSILGKERSRMIAFPRQILMYILRVEMQIPYEELGQILGGRDHSTIMHGVDKITNLLSKDADTRVDIERIKSLV